MNNKKVPLLILVVVVLLGGVLYLAYMLRNSQDALVQTPTSEPEVTEAPTLNTEADLDEELEELSNFDLTDTDAVLDDDLSDLEE